MSLITFDVPAVPVAQPRQRSRVINANGRSFSHNYTPAKHPVNAFKAAVQLAASQVHRGAPLDGPLSMRLVFTLPRPKSKTKKRGDNPRYEHTGRPDCDNLAKSVLDSLSGFVIADDCQVYALTVEKWVASAAELPGVVVTIQSVNPPNP